MSDYHYLVFYSNFNFSFHGSIFLNFLVVYVKLERVIDIDVNVDSGIVSSAKSNSVKWYLKYCQNLIFLLSRIIIFYKYELKWKKKFNFVYKKHSSLYKK